MTSFMATSFPARLWAPEEYSISPPIWEETAGTDAALIPDDSGEGTMDANAVAEQLLTASTAFAGLILVFLGNVVSAFEGYRKEDRKAVLPRFRFRSRLAFVGFASSLSSAILALAHNWCSAPWVVYVSVACLLIALACTFLAAYREMRDVS